MEHIPVCSCAGENMMPKTKFQLTFTLWIVENVFDKTSNFELDRRHTVNEFPIRRPLLFGVQDLMPSRYRHLWGISWTCRPDSRFWGCSSSNSIFLDSDVNQPWQNKRWGEIEMRRFQRRSGTTERCLWKFCFSPASDPPYAQTQFSKNDPFVVFVHRKLRKSPQRVRLYEDPWELISEPNSEIRKWSWQNMFCKLWQSVRSQKKPLVHSESHIWFVITWVWLAQNQTWKNTIKSGTWISECQVFVEIGTQAYPEQICFHKFWQSIGLFGNLYRKNLCDRTNFFQLCENQQARVLALL